MDAVRSAVDGLGVGRFFLDWQWSNNTLVLVACLLYCPSLSKLVVGIHDKFEWGLSTLIVSVFVRYVEKSIMLLARVIKCDV